MAGGGWEIDSHSLTHPDLTAVSGPRLRREVDLSRAVLRRLFHQPVDFFCYPSGRFDGAVIGAVRRAGYLGASTTLPGLARRSQRYVMRRIRVDGDEAPSVLLSATASR